MAFPTAEDVKRHAIAAAAGAAVDVVPGVVAAHRGKVRDVFVDGDELLLVATDRVSAFDVVLGTIPLKGQLLTEQSAFWLEKARDIAPTHLLERVDAAVLRCRRAEAFPVELVVRGHLAGSLLREPPETRGRAYGVVVPDVGPYQAFPAPLITPTTKEAVGLHDQPCSLDDLVAGGRISRAHLERAVEIALALFRLGQGHAAAQGLILVDTKYELGLIDGAVSVIDEVHTADSSRFWVAASFADRVARGEAPEMLDKENLRRWLLAQGFSGTGPPPALDDAVRADLAAHYWTLTERVLGRPFSPQPGGAARLAEIVKAFQQNRG
jgi:phosphoribosylaminoimidazole-succinocarboxamide synthase